MPNTNHIEYWLSTSTDEIFNNLSSFATNENGERYAFIDNGADVLAVAHLDTVQELSGLRQYGKNREGQYIISATGLDDRLGAYAIWNMLPFKVDILLTEGEETGNSTAELFPVSKDYRYLLEIDRGGDDAVTYSHDSPEFLSDLKSCGFEIGVGSFTDLCYIDSDIARVNIGAGYYGAHALDSYAIMDELQASIDKIARFNALGKSYRVSNPSARVSTARSRQATQPNSWARYDVHTVGYCCMCGSEGEYDIDFPACDDCGDAYQDIMGAYYWEDEM